MLTKWFTNKGHIPKLCPFFYYGGVIKIMVFTGKLWFCPALTTVLAHRG